MKWNITDKLFHSLLKVSCILWIALVRLLFHSLEIEIYGNNHSMVRNLV